MNPRYELHERLLQTLRLLAHMPFMDSLELAAVSGWPERTSYHAIGRLRDTGLIDSVPHATIHISRTRRFYVTTAGLHRLAESDRLTSDELLSKRPVSAHWRRLMLERLDTVGVIYRVASAVGNEIGPMGLRWYRAGPIDAGMSLPNGRTVGVVRQGATSDRTSFSKRMWRLLESSLPDTLLVIVPDRVRLLHARRVLRGTGVPTYLALESDAAYASGDDPVWHTPSFNTAVSLGSALSRTRLGGQLLAEPPLSRPSLPGNIVAPTSVLDAPDHLLPTVIGPTEKKVLDILYDWPWMMQRDIGGLLCVSQPRVSALLTPLVSARLVKRIHMGGRNRLALTDRGLAMLARRDRTSVGMAKKRWSVEPKDSESPCSWRNISGSRSRMLARNMDHTEAVHRFLAQLTRQARTQGYEIVQFDPPHRASRYFQRQGTLRSIHPDAFGIVRKGARTVPFFLEWEHRAVRPVTMAARLAPYLRYYSSFGPTDDHGAQPIVLMVFDDVGVESRFLGVAREEMRRAKVEVPLWVSHREVLKESGPLGRVWRSPDVLAPAHAFVVSGFDR